MIAGTGTIDDSGQVGPIGGIARSWSARRRPARPCPGAAENCAEAVRNPQPGLPMFRVATLDDGLAALEALRTGGDPTRC